MKTQYFIGIDLHKDNAYWTIKNPKGEIAKQVNFSVDESKTRALAQEIRSLSNATAVLEPVCAWRKYSRWLEDEGIQVKVVDPLKVKAIAYNRLKHDRADSEILADLLRLNYLPEIKPQSQSAVALSYFVKLRQFLVQKRTKLKQKTREILIKENQEIKRCDVFGKKARKEIRALDLPTTDQKMIDFILKVALPLNQSIKELDDYLEDSYGTKKNIEILRSIPGVGQITALAIESIVGDWSRFTKHGDLASYAGLVPSSRDSGGKIKRGRITKRGSRLLRAMTYQAALTASRYEPFKDFYERIKLKKNGKVARVALARKLLTIAWHLVKKQEQFKLQTVVLKEQQKPDLVFRLAPLGGCTID